MSNSGIVLSERLENELFSRCILGQVIGRVRPGKPCCCSSDLEQGVER